MAVTISCLHEFSNQPNITQPNSNLYYWKQFCSELDPIAGTCSPNLPCVSRLWFEYFETKYGGSLHRSNAISRLKLERQSFVHILLVKPSKNQPPHRTQPANHVKSVGDLGTTPVLLVGCSPGENSQTIHYLYDMTMPYCMYPCTKIESLRTIPARKGRCPPRSLPKQL